MMLIPIFALQNIFSTSNQSFFASLNTLLPKLTQKFNENLVFAFNVQKKLIFFFLFGLSEKQVKRLKFIQKRAINEVSL